jgi:carboxyl-terminal processing protease
MFLAGAVPALAGPQGIEGLRKQALEHERLRQWDKACLAYDAILRLNRNLPEVKERLFFCLRRCYQVYRQDDRSFREVVDKLAYHQAVKVYQVVLARLLDGAVDRKPLTPTRLFRHGLDELHQALAEPAFLQRHLPAADPLKLEELREALRTTWRGKVARNQLEAAEMARQDTMQTISTLEAKETTASAIMMELTCGACYAVDRYTMYLTPTVFQELLESVKGEVADVGLRFMVQNNKVVVTAILARSAAAEAMPTLSPGDFIIRIDGKMTEALSIEAVQLLMQGRRGTKVVLEIHSPMGLRQVTLERRLIPLRSILPAEEMAQPTWFVREGIGYVRISHFQETTPQELDDVLAPMTKVGMKALIVDLRSNGGGHFEAAIETARRFLSTGVIASTQHPDPRQNRTYKARSSGALTVPMVVLVDGETASAAEVLAGALKEHKRATLVGNTTFGKSCLQGLFPLALSASPREVEIGGLKLTVARFCSPSGVPYTGRGVVPDITVERDQMAGSLDPRHERDNQLEEAIDEAQRLIDRARAPRPY